ncbi:TonB-dependent receptor plug domain-containing protein [Flavobacterium sp. LB2P84]|jgi:TonB-dependent SusC/RagA subfamily outer membrane receptor|uniref:TonB-dependent receptor plug domain-containing protein n=1 Tax=Flavobacterium yafengii TaxID=3041253 RepID=UPI0024A7B253|nr:TonB-dependent receptor plug domain-containing protein [Flavobacterium yafengii]MDI6034030.1 TonB-dependent receptor plug domain-containing protein [Flavobacterium yafengii]
MKISRTLVVIFFVFVGFGHAQNKLTGKVMDNKSKPVANARIYLDSIYSNVSTNSKGDFEVLLPEKVAAINVYSYKFGLLSSKFNNENVMNFMFLESQKSIKDRAKNGDKISIGYSEVDKQYKVNTAQSLDAQNDKNSSIYNTIYDLIRGRLAGVTVTRDNRITIRGVSSIRNIGDPLFVVDGVIVSSIDYISPNNVKSVSVLKDAAASIYGAQGASGVILINTK